MSYLTLSAGIPDFSKAVFSLWFRVPRESVIAASTNKIGGDWAIMQSILPLMTLGVPQIGTVYPASTHDVAVIHTYRPGEPDSETTFMTDYYPASETHDVDPSYIGLVCLEDGKFNMVFNLQMKDFMSRSAGSVSYITTKMDIYSGSDPGCPQYVLGNGVVIMFPNVGVATIAAAPYLDQTQPELFQVVTRDYLKPDQWHHLLLSFDISGSVSIGTPFASSDCRLWYAIDDVDYRGAENMLPYRDLGGQWGPDTLGPNTILTQNVWRYSGSDPNWQAPQYYMNHFVGLPQGTFSRGIIPADGYAIGIPSSIKYVDSIFRCEMAEFQMWTGVTLDTGSATNRRAFVDENGKPVNPTKGTEDDPRGPGEKLLGKKPEILLHGSNNWQVGHNTGTFGGQFTPTAKIEKYRPEPALEETPIA